jgi:hypothetical protein
VITLTVSLVLLAGPLAAQGPLQGKVYKIGILTEPHAVRRLLAALGLAAEPPPARPLPAA